MNEWHPQVWFVLAIVAVFRIAADRLDRQRICEHVESTGGTVEDIAWNPFGTGWFGSRNERIYEVTYRTRHGKTVSATCKTSMWSGVYWTSDAPPSDFSEPPAETTECLSCGTPIPANQSRCLKCGWSYQ